MSEADPLDIFLRAITYPYQVPMYSYLQLGEHSIPLNADNLSFLRGFASNEPPALSNSGIRYFLAGTAEVDRAFTPILAAGSNASPQQLLRKFGDAQGLAIPVVHGQIGGYSSVYSAHLTRYGALPATLFSDSEAVTRLHCLFVPKRLKIGRAHV